MNFIIVGAFEKRPQIVWLPGLYDVICRTCRYPNRLTDAEQQVFITGGFLTQQCPNCKTPYGSTPAPSSDAPRRALDNEFFKFGKTVADVLAHRGKASNIDLDSNIGFILLDKVQHRGLKSLSEPERFVYVVQGMSREVNNGGFDQFFGNSSGELAFDLVPALKAMGFIDNLSIASRALERFGKPRSLKEATRMKHLAKITNDGDKNLWGDLDKEFYENPEDIESLILDYVASHSSAFGA